MMRSTALPGRCPPRTMSHPPARQDLRPVFARSRGRTSSPSSPPSSAQVRLVVRARSGPACAMSTLGHIRRVRHDAGRTSPRCPAGFSSASGLQGTDPAPVQVVAAQMFLAARSRASSQMSHQHHAARPAAHAPAAQADAAAACAEVQTCGGLPRPTSTRSARSTSTSVSMRGMSTSGVTSQRQAVETPTRR